MDSDPCLARDRTRLQEREFLGVISQLQLSLFSTINVIAELHLFLSIRDLILQPSNVENSHITQVNLLFNLLLLL